MEAAGLALGVAGLAGLFSACASCYQLVRRGADLGKDHKILETKFNNQELRLLSGGKACGLVGTDIEYDTRLDEPVLRARIQATLECIKELFQDEAELKKRFGLKPSKNNLKVKTSALLSLRSSSQVIARPSFFFWKKQQRTTRLRDDAAWAISDRAKFAELVQHLKDFNDDLESMTRALGDIPQKQRQIVELEISEIADLETLEEIALASQDDEDIISDTVSLRLSSIRSGSIWTSNSTRDTTSFKTAPTSIPAAIDETLNSNPLTFEPAEITAPLTKAPPLKSYKCCVVGDLASQKTRLLSSFTLGHLPDRYIPTIFEDYTVDCRLDGFDLQLQLFDTSGQEEYERLRPLAYVRAHVVLLCFRADEPTPETKEGILRKWSPEIRKSCPDAPVVLVGLKCESEEVEEEKGVEEVGVEKSEGGGKEEEEAEHDFVPLSITANIGALRYFFCDPEWGFGVDELFEYVSGTNQGDGNDDQTKLTSMQALRAAVYFNKRLSGPPPTSLWTPRSISYSWREPSSPSDR